MTCGMSPSIAPTPITWTATALRTNLFSGRWQAASRARARTQGAKMALALRRLHDGAPAPVAALVASLAVERDRAALTFVEIHAGLIVHQITRLADRGELPLHFARSRDLVFGQDGFAGQRANAIPQLVHAHAVAAADVEHLAGHPSRGRASGEQVRVHHVRDLHEIAGIVTLTINRRRVDRGRRRDDTRHNRRAIPLMY